MNWHTLLFGMHGQKKERNNIYVHHQQWSSAIIQYPIWF